MRTVFIILIVIIFVPFFAFNSNISQVSENSVSHASEFEYATVNPNFRLHPSVNSHQNEAVITRHPLNPNIFFASSITTKIGGPLFLSEGVYVSTNAGQSWYGTDTLPGNPPTGHNGDPALVIDKDGRFIITRLGFGLNIFSAFSANNGISWSNHIPVSQTNRDDKNFMTTDDSPSSPFYGRTYVAWTRFHTPLFGYIYLSYTTNGGVSWSEPKKINNSITGHFSQGVDLRVGPEGELYLCWANSDAFSQFYVEKYIGFGKSTDGGETWQINEKAFQVSGIRTSPFGEYMIFVVGYPRIDVDRSGGARDGWIYITTPQKFFGPAQDAADIILNRSTDGGATWSNGIRVNQDAPGNGKLQFIPAVRVDEGGGVNVVYYDNRNVADSIAQIYLSRSLDGGNSWSDFIVSDHNFALKPLPGYPLPFIGEYIGATSSLGRLFPVWMDNSTGNYQIWTAPVELNTPVLNPFVLSFPQQADTIITVPDSDTGYNFNWSQSSSYATYRWILEVPGNPLALKKLALSNSLTVESGKFDSVLKSSNVQQGSTVSVQWDVWAFRNNSPMFDSLKSGNGPRQIFLRRSLPVLSSFNLSSPPGNTSITTFPDYTAQLKFRWQRSGSGVRYKWNFGSPSASNTLFSFDAGGQGFDSTFSIRYSLLDTLLAGIGIQRGDSITGQWNITAYNEIDSIFSAQSFVVTFKRGEKAEILIAYDSTRAGSRIALDSVRNNLSLLKRSFEIVNKKNINTGQGFTLKGYNKIIWLGSGSSTMSASQRDSVRAYLSSGGTSDVTRSKIIIFSQDFAWQHARSGSSNLDPELCGELLGINYIADSPPSGGEQGLIGAAINPGIEDSTTGPYPDVIDRSTIENTDVLYRYRSDNTINAIGKRGNTYRSALFSFDLESLLASNSSPPGSPVLRILQSVLNYVDGTVGIEQNSSIIPTDYYMSQNYPNPFNPVTNIKFALPGNGRVALKIYDVLGREIAVLINESLHAGYYNIKFDASNFASGAYFYRIVVDSFGEPGGFIETKRMMLIK